MADQIKLQEVAVIVYKDDYKGSPPPVTIQGLKAGDLAVDTSFNILWEFTGAKWCKKAFTNGGKIYLGAGNTIYDMIFSPDTRTPAWMEVYAGSDVRVPRDLQLSADNLVIHHGMSDPPIIMATYYNSKDGKWYNIQPAPGAIVTSSVDGWSMWIGYLTRVARNKAIISIFDIGSQNPNDTRAGSSIQSDPGGGGDEPGGVASPADKLPAATVSNLSMLSDYLKIDANGNLIVGADGEVVTRRKKFITRTHLDENNVLWLDYPPISVISPAGDVFHMNSKYDEDKGKYRLDFSSITMAGSIWTIIY